MKKKKQRPLKRGRQRLRPRARLIRAIGQDLISSPVIAVVELIKNSYDADANEVTISFKPPLMRGKGSITVADDGHGMPLNVLQSAWWEPATARKKKNPRSPRGRPVTGEKGLGRFAVARLAGKLHVESTVTAPKPRRVVADFDWSLFDNDRKFLDEVNATWAEYAAPAKAKKGTTLTLDELRDDWDDEAFSRLHSELARVVAGAGTNSEFRIKLALPVPYERFSGVVAAPKVLARPHYAFDGGVDAMGVARGTLTVQQKSFAIESALVADKEPFPCGPFKFEFKVWDRDGLEEIARDLDIKIKDVRSDLNEASGVSVYRDTFRVMPYGGRGDDWLHLDHRRIQNPTMRISNNQIVGSIRVTADANPTLRDQTNREGLVDGPALTTLRAALTALVAKIEAARYDYRHPREKTAVVRSALFADVSLDPIQAAFRTKYPDDKLFQDFLDERAAALGAAVERVQQVVSRYRRLATLGQLIDAILHDGRTPISSIGSQCTLAQRDLDRISDIELLKSRLSERFSQIAQQIELLSALFKRVSPFGGRKRGRPTPRALEHHIEDAFRNFTTRAERIGVRLALPQTNTIVTTDPAEMQQVFINLFDNALYWLEKVPQERRAIQVGVVRTAAGVTVEFSDSGPGVPEAERQLIFDPYYSTKPDGIGLGLTIVGETISEYGGTVELLDEGLLPGANFRLTLRERVKPVADEETT